MSWDSDPFRALEIIEPTPGEPELHCHNCGMQKPLVGGRAMTLDQIWAVWLDHVTKSHKLTRADTEGWSVP